MAIDECRGRQRRGRNHEHGVVEKPRLAGHVHAQHRQVQSHAAAGQIGRRIGDLAQHLGHHQARDREIVPAQMQDRTTEQGRKQRDNDAGRDPCRQHGHALALKHAAGIGAEPEECGGGKGWIAREAADEIPAQRQRAVHQHRGRDPQHVIVGERRQRHQQDRSRYQQKPGHSKPLRPMIPLGRNINSRISSENEIVIECSGPKNSAA